MHLLPRGFPSVFFIFVCAVVCGKDGDAYHLNLCYQPIECGDTFHIKETGIEFVDDYGIAAGRLHIRIPEYAAGLPLWERSVLRQSHKFQFLVGNDDASDQNSNALEIRPNGLKYKPPVFFKAQATDVRLLAAYSEQGFSPSSDASELSLLRSRGTRNLPIDTAQHDALGYVTFKHYAGASQSWRAAGQIYGALDDSGKLTFATTGNIRQVAAVDAVDRISIDGRGRDYQTSIGASGHARIYQSQSLRTGVGTRVEAQNLTSGAGVRILPGARHRPAMRTNCTLYANGTLLLPRKVAATYLPGDRVELLNCTSGANEGVYSVRHSSPTLVIIQTVEGQGIECAGTHDTCTVARPY